MKESEKALSRITPGQAKMLYGVLLGNDASTMDPEMQYTPLMINLALDRLRSVLLERMEEHNIGDVNKMVYEKGE